MKHPNVIVVSGYSGQCVYQEVHVTNLREYCTKWGYTYSGRFNFKRTCPSRFPFWTKHEILSNEIFRLAYYYDWVLWLDADTIVADMNKPLSDFMSDKDITISSSAGVLETAVMLLRLSYQTKDLLSRWWEAGDPESMYWDDTLFPIFPDNPVWQQEPYCKSPPKDGMIGKDTWMYAKQLFLNNDNNVLHGMVKKDNIIRSMFNVIENKSFVVKNPHFTQGDFIVHAPGATEEEKLRVLTEISKEVVR